MENKAAHDSHFGKTSSKTYCSVDEIYEREKKTNEMRESISRKPRQIKILSCYIIYILFTVKRCHLQSRMQKRKPRQSFHNDASVLNVPQQLLWKFCSVGGNNFLCLVSNFIFSFLSLPLFMCLFPRLHTLHLVHSLIRHFFSTVSFSLSLLPSWIRTICEMISSEPTFI